MTGARTVSHDFEIVYAEQDVDAATVSFTGRASADGLGVVVTGDCPRCHGSTASEYRYGLPGTGTKGLWSKLTGTARTEPDPGSVTETLRQETYFCECGHPHPQLPGNAVFVGCGASWQVRSLIVEGAP
ncbi:hypothetical protein [Streptomyces typhae]|uniref:hypothetical protein n=1 Tax=Streptomyces typhae TaxID=2681492 RepID=UPI0012F65D68|nr:hypothetical protein [Streptomyces typhae]